MARWAELAWRRRKLETLGYSLALLQHLVLVMPNIRHHSILCHTNINVEGKIR
jgi:hypothetical protein